VLKFKILVTILLFFLFPSSIHAATYYLSPSGSDSNNGLSSSTPWLSPNHALNCGDTILAAPGNTYNASNFSSGRWGSVTCSGNNVAWLKCGTFDTCKISTSSNDAMRVSSSNWGVQGWEATNTVGACFTASPATNSATIHHIVFANNIANGCKNNGFNSYPYSGSVGPAGVDYFAVIGNLAYDAAGGNNYCFSGISIYEPRNYDSITGTHIYIAQNISWNNIDGATCPGNSDGEGIILDDWNGDQSQFTPAYSGQGVVENNLILGNGSAGIEPFHNTASPIIIQNNTAYGNYTDIHHSGTYNGEILYNWSTNVVARYNISHNTVATAGTTTYPVFGFYVGRGDGTDVVDYNWIYSANSHSSGVNSSNGFAYGTHQIVGTNPSFTNPQVPGAPNCGGKSNSLDCMKTTLAGFIPTASGISGYGYQPVTGSYIQNDYYPQWLCNVTLPNGIISNYCNVSVSTPTPTPVFLKGDINHDGVVNIQDFTLLSNAFGTNNTAADINSDGIVNVQDYILLSNNFGKTD
jgi:hypothetical protein